MEVLKITRISINRIEAKYFEEYGESELQDFPFAFGIRKSKCIQINGENQSIIGKSEVTQLLGDIRYLQSLFPATRIIPFIQWKKGDYKDPYSLKLVYEALKNVEDIELPFYELWTGQEVKDFESQIDLFIKEYKSERIFVVLEMESKNLLTKIFSAISRKLKNFIIVGGEWSNVSLWNDVIHLIKRNNCESIVYCCARMNTHSKEAFFRKVILYGADHVVHGSPHGRNNENTVIRVFNEKTGFYEEWKNIEDLELSERMIGLKTRTKQYGFSRVFSLNNADIFAKTYRPKVIV